MIFTLVSVALEWLNERWDSSVKEKEEADERKRLQEEEEEHVCCQKMNTFPFYLDIAIIKLDFVYDTKLKLYLNRML